MLKRALLISTLSLLFVQPAIADDGCDGGCGRHNRGGRDRGGDNHRWRGDNHQRDWDRGRHHSHYSRPRSFVSFSYNSAPYPYWHSYPRPYPYSYYRPRTVIYAPAPAIIQPEVVYMDDSNSRIVSSNDGRYCREYQSTVRVGGVSQPAYGTACQQPDGSWEIVS